MFEVPRNPFIPSLSGEEAFFEFTMCEQQPLCLCPSSPPLARLLYARLLVTLLQVLGNVVPPQSGLNLSYRGTWSQVLVQPAGSTKEQKQQL